MTLPRVTFSNIGTDFPGGHGRPDRELPARGFSEASRRGHTIHR